VIVHNVEVKSIIVIEDFSDATVTTGVSAIPFLKECCAVRPEMEIDRELFSQSCLPLGDFIVPATLCENSVNDAIRVEECIVRQAFVLVRFVAGGIVANLFKVQLGDHVVGRTKMLNSSLRGVWGDDSIAQVAEDRIQRL